MSENFFANYKKFVVPPRDQQKVENEEFNPKDYASYYILTLSLNDSLISSWNEAKDYEIDIHKSILKVLKEFNEKQYGNKHLRLLELENDNSYFVIALSCKNKSIEPIEEISNYIEKMISTPFYIGQNWYRLIGHKGRVERKIFHITLKEYSM